MVQGKVKWTARARLNLREIFEYWNQRNGDSDYSRKLSKLFLSAGQKLEPNPYLGKKSGISETRYLVVENYLLIYRIKLPAIDIISVWDGRRNPEDFEKIIRNN